MPDFEPPELDFEAKKEELTQKLFRKNYVLTLFERELSENLSEENQFRVELGRLGDEIAQLEVAHPDDEEVQMLRQISENLYWQLDNVDEGLRGSYEVFDQILDQVRRKVESSSVKKLEKDDPIFASEVEIMENLGVDVSYGVSSGDPEAPTVILFANSHYTNYDSADTLEAYGVDASRKEVFEDIVSLVNAGMADSVFAEGLLSGYEYEAEDITENYPVNDSKLMLGPKLHVFGYEDYDLNKTIQRIPKIIGKVLNCVVPHIISFLLIML